MRNIIIMMLVLFCTIQASAQQQYTFQRNDFRLEILRGTQIRNSMLLEDVRWIERNAGETLVIFDGVQTFSVNDEEIANYSGGNPIDSLINDLETWRLLSVTRVSGDTLFIGNDTLIIVDGIGQVDSFYNASNSTWLNTTDTIPIQIDSITFTDPYLYAWDNGAKFDSADISGVVLSQEEVEDYAGAMWTGNTETLITVTYQDIDGTIDAEVTATLSSYTDDLGHVEESTTVTDAANGLDITLSTYDITVATDFIELAAETTLDATDYVVVHDATTPNDGVITIANFEGQINHDNLSGFVANEHIDHSTVTLTAGDGLNDSGTGDITASRTFAVDPSDAAGQAPDLADLIIVEDVTDGGIHSATFTQIQTLIDTDTQWDSLTFSNPYIYSWYGGSKADSADISAIDTKLTQEEVEDYAGNLVAVGGTKIGITITYQDATGDMDFDVDHDAATNFVANEHIDHTAVSVTAGTGLSGGGDISATRSFDLDFSELTDVATMAGADEFIIQDGTVESRITLTELEPVVNHDNLLGFVANEHVDHSTVTLTAGDGLNDSGTGDITASRTFNVDPSDAAGQAPDLADLLIVEDVTDGGIHSATFTQVQTLINTDTQIDSVTFSDPYVYIWDGGAKTDSADISGVTPTETVAIGVACSDLTSDLATGTSKGFFHAPYAFTLTEVRAQVLTAPVGQTINVDINEGGVSVLSTVITIDASEKTSQTAATPPVISDSSIADDGIITIDIDQVGSSTKGVGLVVWLIGTK